MTEARRLLERIVEAHEVEDWLDIRQEIATYLAQPMTTCEGLTEEEQEWYVDAGYDEAGERIAPTSKTADRMQTVLRSLAESRVREGGLVAALALFPKIAGCHRKRLLLADAEVECDHCDKLMAEIRMLCARAAQGKKE